MIDDAFYQKTSALRRHMIAVEPVPFLLTVVGINCPHYAASQHITGRLSSQNKNGSVHLSTVDDIPTKLMP